MSEPFNDGGPAFPRSFSVDARDVNNRPDQAQEGMSLRDYFAAKAMQGYLAAGSEIGERARESPDAVAEWAYRNADSMLKARESRNG